MTIKDRAILLIEDNRPLSDMLTFRLQDQGAVVHTAANESEVDDQLKQRSYDLILLDFMIPGTDGIEVLKKIKGMNIQTPVIMVTAKAMSMDRDMCLSHGAAAYVLKPIDFNLLFSTMDDLLAA